MYNKPEILPVQPLNQVKLGQLGYVEAQLGTIPLKYELHTVHVYIFLSKFHF